MNPRRTFLPKKAFTLVELLVVITIIVIIFAIMIPSPNHSDHRALQFVCMNNLKQIGLGLIMYSEDNKNQFPWQVSYSAIGTTETGKSSVAANYFPMLTNINAHPRMFICPADKTRTAATNFTNFSNSNLSYFVSVSATAFLRTNQSLLILAGDRHLSLNNLPAKPGLCIVETYSAPGWTREMHYSRDEGPRGNLLFADGHATSFSSSEIPANFKSQPINPSRLAIP